jgi:MOSC domain-containing protein YiiM
LNIKHAFKDGQFGRVSQTRRPGWSRVYTRVIVEGRIRRGDAARVVGEIEAEARRARA